MLAFFEIQKMIALAFCLLGRKAHVEQNRISLAAYAVMARGKLKVIALVGVGYTAPGKECAPDKRRLAARFLKYTEIYVQRQGAYVVAEGIIYRFYLFLVVNYKAALAAQHLGQLVKAEGKRFFEQVRQTLGKLVAGGDYSYELGRKCVAVQQNAVSLGDGAAFALDSRLTQLRFDLLRKGHISHPLQGRGL